MSLLGKFFSALGSFFGHLFGVLKDAEQKALTDFAAKITPEILKLGLDAVKAVVLLKLGDVAAREEAISIMKKDAAVVGIDLANFAKNELNAIVELVYVAVKTAA